MTSPKLHTVSVPRARVIAFASLAALLLLLPAVSACSKDSSKPEAVAAEPGDSLVARINGVEVRQSDLALAEEDMGQELQQVPQEQRRDHLISYLADVIAVTQIAEQKKLGETADFKRRLAFLRRKLLMGYGLQEEVKSALTDEARRQVYQDAIKSIGEQEEVRARHILVETEDEAKAVVEQLKAGADFAALAKEKSKDPGATDGGDLGYFVKDQMVKEFAEVAFKMYPGQTSNPVKTQFGWHVIKLEDRRQKKAPDFETVKEQVDTFLARKAQTEFVAKLRQSAKIERLDKPAGEEKKPAGEGNKPAGEENKPAAEKK